MDSHQPKRPYNGIATQRAAILARLERGPATGAQLQSECNAPDPTRRIHELREAGHLIDTTPTAQENPDGTINSSGCTCCASKTPGRQS